MEMEGKLASLFSMKAGYVLLLYSQVKSLFCVAFFKQNAMHVILWSFG